MKQEPIQELDKLYIVYFKGNCVCVGTVDECVKFIGCTKASFYCNVTRTKQGKIVGEGYQVYKIDDLI